jgi:DNA invertase Pin-like site-specific DNA recombinase
MKVALYARVSTEDQLTDLQLQELREYCDRMGWEDRFEYVETASGGALAKRPELKRLMEDAKRRAFDVVVVWKLDRFGRSLLEVMQRIVEFDRCRVRFICTTQAIDTDFESPTSRLLVHLLGAFAEFERSLLQQRVKSGVAAYRKAVKRGDVKRGVRHSRSGRDLPHGRPKKIFRRDDCIKLWGDGMPQRQIAASLKVGLGTVNRAIKEHLASKEGSIAA